jgi:hypothetical protein
VAALNLVHGDLCGLIMLTTSGGRCFFILLVDDATHYMWLKLITSKSDVVVAIKVVTELEVRCPLRVLRTDNGGEFTSTEFATYYANEGIQRHFSAPYTPQHNDVVECQNWTMLGMT